MHLFRLLPRLLQDAALLMIQGLAAHQLHPASATRTSGGRVADAAPGRSESEREVLVARFNRIWDRLNPAQQRDLLRQLLEAVAEGAETSEG